MPTLHVETSKPGTYECYLRYGQDGFPVRGARTAEFEFSHPIGDWSQPCVVRIKAPFGMRGNAPTYINVRYIPPPELHQVRAWVPRSYCWTRLRPSNDPDVALAAHGARLRTRQLLTQLEALARRYPYMELATWYAAAHIAMQNATDDERAPTELRIVEDLHGQMLTFLRERGVDC